MTKPKIVFCFLVLKINYLRWFKGKTITNFLPLHFVTVFSASVWMQQCLTKVYCGFSCGFKFTGRMRFEQDCLLSVKIFFTKYFENILKTKQKIEKRLLQTKNMNFRFAMRIYEMFLVLKEAPMVCKMFVKYFLNVVWIILKFIKIQFNFTCTYMHTYIYKYSFSDL